MIESHIILEQWCWCEIISNIIIWSVESELLNNYECWIRWNEIHYNGFIFLFKVMDNWHRTLSYNENDFSLSKWLGCWYSVQCFVLLVLLHFTRMTGIVVSHSIEFTLFDQKNWWWRCWHFLHILLRRFLWDLKLDTWLWLLTLNAMSTWIRNKGLCRNIACRNVYDLTMSWDIREDWWDLRCYRLKNALRMVHC